jgi:hypothetical protein
MKKITKKNISKHNRTKTIHAFQNEFKKIKKNAKKNSKKNVTNSTKKTAKN